MSKFWRLSTAPQKLCNGNKFCHNLQNRLIRPIATYNNHKSEQNSSRCKTLLGFGVSMILSGGCYYVYNKMMQDEQLQRSKHFLSLKFANCSPFDENKTKEKKSKMFNFIADAVESCSPGVVFIEVTSSKNRHSFFHRGGPTSCGSGFFVSKDGLVLTNAHVVDDAEQVVIKMPNGTKYNGSIIDRDPITDLAVIKVQGEKHEEFPSLELGSSSSVRAGEWVAALGSPLQLSNTITSGIVSSTQRGAGELGLPNSEMQYIQTDAAINVGNSGGPLINLDGEVIGINSITVQAVSGISFAIPIDVAKDFLQTAKRRLASGNTSPVPSGKIKSYQRFFIGITMLTLTPSLVEDLRQRSADYRQVSGGVLVARVAPRSPAERAGLVSGDVIVSIDGDSVDSAGQVHSSVLKGKPMNIQVQRGQSLIALTISPQPIARL